MRMRRTAAVLASCSLVGLSAGEEIITDIQQGTNIALALSPDGSAIVVDLLGQLWTLPVTGGAATPLTPPDEVVRNPRFSTDGQFLVYQRSVAGQWDLWLLETATGLRRQLTGAPFDERCRERDAR